VRRCLTLLVVSLVAWPAGLATARIPSTPTRNHARYVNPFANTAWEPSRIDLGVDWVPVHKLPVLAIGDARILGSDSQSNWPGHHIIWYQLLDGSHAGDVIYVAEHLRNLVPAGRVVRAGQQIAVALPGDPWTEWGWAYSYGAPRAYPCYKEGHKTNSGKEMARFMASLGASLDEQPGPGPDRPTGKLC
jgi:hypothetical protein